MESNLPGSLRKWFIIHFFADIVFALPLLISPRWFMGLFGFNVGETLTVRLVGAALAGIGLTSLVMHGKGIESYDAMLTLKIIWSVTAIVAILLSIIDGGPDSQWFFLAIFTVFSAVWIYYKNIVINR